MTLLKAKKKLSHLLVFLSAPIRFTRHGDEDEGPPLHFDSLGRVEDELVAFPDRCCFAITSSLDTNHSRFQVPNLESSQVHFGFADILETTNCLLMIQDLKYEKNGNSEPFNFLEIRIN